MVRSAARDSDGVIDVPRAAPAASTTIREAELLPTQVAQPARAIKDLAQLVVGNPLSSHVRSLCGKSLRCPRLGATDRQNAPAYLDSSDLA